MKLYFNLKRPYGPQGQRIVVQIVEYDTDARLDALVFRDFDRNIEGAIILARPGCGFEVGAAFVEMFKLLYDMGCYSHPADSLSGVLDGWGKTFEEASKDAKRASAWY